MDPVTLCVASSGIQPVCLGIQPVRNDHVVVYSGREDFLWAGPVLLCV